MMLVALAVETAALYKIIDDQYSIGSDLRFFQSVAQRWLDTGVYYSDRQLSGPHIHLSNVDNLYPPLALYLFIPFLVLPSILWWIIPIVVIGYVVWWCRPPAWALPILAALLLYPKTPAVVLYGNSDIWAVTFASAGVRWGWPAVLIAFKPSVGFLALPGIATRRWWIAAAVLLVASLPFIHLWLVYPQIVIDSDTDIGRSLSDLPFFSLPFVAWLVSTRRGRTPIGQWALALLKRDGRV